MSIISGCHDFNIIFNDWDAGFVTEIIWNLGNFMRDLFYKVLSE